jgi:uncharacterized protein
MEYRVRVNMLGAAAVLAAGIAASVVTSTVVASRAYQSRVQQAASQGQEITVRGSARTRVRSDLGVWRIVVSGEGSELQEAFSILERGIARVQGFLSERGFTSGEIALSAIETSTFYGRDSAGRETREVSGYRLERAFTITSAGVERVSAAAGEVTQLLRENIRVASSRPAYYISNLPDLRVQIAGEASRDARQRADEIARGSGARVIAVRRAQMGVIQVTEPNSTEVAGYGIYDTRTIEKDVSVVVTLTLGLAQ